MGRAATVSVYVGRPPRFQLRAIRNRRFMFCRRTGELILGGNDVANDSHAAEHGRSGVRGRYDEFVRGWVGFGGGYRHGVLHFAPPFRESELREDVAGFESLMATLEVFAANGAPRGMILRGAATARWEERFEVAYPSVLDRCAPEETEDLAGVTP